MDIDSLDSASTYSAVYLADNIRTGRLSAETVVRHYLDIIDSKNTALNAFIELGEEQALAIARDIDEKVSQGIDPGPLCGVPFGVKDTHHCQGMTTSFGSCFFKDSAPQDQDAVYISRLRRAGAIPLGKTATAEFGLDSATNSKAWGVTRNPWNLALTPGGSSGGSAAAVTAGLAPFCAAGDGGGSIREPASFCGLVGLKPSNGRIPNQNGFDTMSCIGALTTNVRDTARFLDVAAGPDDRDNLSIPAIPSTNSRYEQSCETLEVAGLSCLWSADLGYARVDPEVVEICRVAAEKLIKLAALTPTDKTFTIDNPLPDWARIVVTDAMAELTLLGVWPDGKDRMSDTPRALVERYSCDSVKQLALSKKKLMALQRQTADIYRSVDLIITPAVACLPYAADAPLPTELCGQDISDQGVEPFGMIANICGNPAISIPASVSSTGMPVGLQIMGRRYREDILLRLARLFELQHPWPLQARPSA